MFTGQKLGRAIEEARRKKGVTKKALADRFGVKPPSIQDWVNRGTIDKDKLTTLWAYFADVVPPAHWGIDRYPTVPQDQGVSQEAKTRQVTKKISTNREPPGEGIDFIHASGDFPTLIESKNSATLKSEASSRSRTYGTRRTEQLQVVHLQMMDVGVPMSNGMVMLEHEHSVASMAVDEAWLRRRTKFTSLENLSLLTCTDSSMKPTFDKGDPLVVDRGVSEVHEEGVFVMSSRQGLLIKRVQRMPDDGWRLLCDNDKFLPVEVPFEKRQQYPVLGQVVWAWSSRGM